jgi:hypothetical protein
VYKGGELAQNRGGWKQMAVAVMEPIIANKEVKKQKIINY